MPAFLTSIGAFCLFLLIHVIAWRIIRERKGLLLLAWIAIGSFLLATIVAISAFSEPLSDISMTLPIFGCLTLAYLHLYVGTFRSLSVRILEEIDRAGGHMTTDELDRVYPVKGMFDERFALLARHHWITIDQHGCFLPMRKTVLAAGMIVRLRKLYGIKRAG